MTYLSPGVYVEEAAAGSRPIEGVGTAVAAFIGLAEKGPVNTALRVGAVVGLVVVALAVRRRLAG